MMALSGLVTTLFAAFAAVATMAVARADDYPSRPIRILVGSAPGGAADIGARLAADALSRELKTPIVVELRGGGGGLNAVEASLAAAPDGYTILLAAVGSFTIIPAAKHVSYDVERDFIPLGTVWRSAQVLVVGAASGPATLSQFVADAKARPATVTIGSAGVGTVTHLTIELLRREAAIDVIHVPFRGTGAALPAVIGGQLDALFSDVGVVTPLVEAGKMRALAVTAARRAPALPDVPTMGEAGLPGVIGEVWFGLAVPARTPPGIVKRLQDALAAIHGDPDYEAKLARQHVSAGEPGPGPFADLIKHESAKWRAIVDAAAIKLD